MANVIINDTHLTNIANAIREKNGTASTYKPKEMAAAIKDIKGGGSVSGLSLEVSGDAPYFNHKGYWDSIITGDNEITFKEITHGEGMFKYSKLESIPDIELADGAYNLNMLFYGCENLKELPNLILPTGKYIYNSELYDSTGKYKGTFESIFLRMMFGECKNLRYIDTNYLSKLFTKSTTFNLPYDIKQSGMEHFNSRALATMFSNCYSLRNACSLSFLSANIMDTFAYGAMPYWMTFNNCYALDEIDSFPVFNLKLTTNQFSSFVNNCSRLKKLTFMSISKTLDWNKQTIDLSTSGFGVSTNILKYNSGITADKEVKNSTTYAALKDDADWFSQSAEFSRYDKASAIETINSLPYTTGSNNIKFKGSAGSGTDGGAINTLSEEEIAVATAKGWTISYMA